MKQLGLGLLLSLSFTTAQAVSTTKPIDRGVVKGHYMDRTVKALHMTHDKGMDDLQKQGHWAYRNLITLAFDEKQSMQLRWRALTRMAKIGGKNSVPELEKAARSQDWFMRSASLVGLRRVDRESAVTWARQLLKDPALVVRAEAVTTLSRMLDKSAKNELWTELYADKNFRHGKSLWVRRKIAEVYSRLSDSEDIANLIKILEDKDATLHSSAISGLERITKKSFGADREISFKNQEWRKWYSQNQGSLQL